MTKQSQEYVLNDLFRLVHRKLEGRQVAEKGMPVLIEEVDHLIFDQAQSRAVPIGFRRNTPPYRRGPIRHELPILDARACRNHLQRASDPDTLSRVRSEGEETRRSGCPVSISLEVFGDRWSLLIVRDLMVRGHRTFKEFAESGEGIATNVLSDRLKRLQRAGIIVADEEASDLRRVHYQLTEKGISLAPVILELLIWAAHHEETGAPCGVIEHMARNREQLLKEVRRRWLEKDRTPILPKFEAQTKTKGEEGLEQSSSTGRNAKRGIHPVRRRNP